MRAGFHQNNQPTYERKMPYSSFGNLPVELLQAIASCLPARDLCIFRLACKRIYESTLYLYRCKFFGELQTDLSLRSLKRMETIASDPELAPHVHFLTVKFIADFENTLGEGLVWNRHTSGYLKSNADVQRWGEVLRGLVNCASFHLIRDGWSDKDSCLDHFTSTDIVTLVLTSIINQNMTVREFLVDFIQPGTGGANELDLRRLNVPDLRGPEFIATWANLEVLLLNFTMSNIEILEWIDPMVRHATSLQELTIQFDSGSAGGEILRHLSSLETPRLQKLSLQGIPRSAKVDGALLSKLLHKHRDSLRVLSIKVFTLEIRLFTLDSPGWKPILGMLSEFPRLESASFHALREGQSLIQFPVASEIPEFDGATQFTFRSRRQKDRTVNHIVHCWGPKTKAIIQRLAESMELPH
ncbi:hypothetical protein P168DRAFT_133719 [Aspergillus campestris IBT 28561]|uniref:F-box domain-containing protein n=1 Tax=Aspergillus campestris (strain IBT 28561) TaxID=1392248 RepID=A0A2I1D856_ASPC2|nr:uncharacterized protein P168DRAFT_133719 [Aspergillus campestris IBT 28561]PKY06028.1 hypothetical protein P168DRAFT_133719 [Aspergillus campestris IBT 28561]